LAGESAHAKYERIRAGRTQRARDNVPLLLVLTAVATIVMGVLAHLYVGTWWVGVLFGLLMVGNLLVPTQREVAWRKGAEGERVVARAIDALASTHAVHDRLAPGSRANIDHVVVAPSGVWTIDAKNYTGRIETRGRGHELWVKGRNRSKLLDQARRQTAVVRDVLAAAGLGHVPVRPALCFVGVEWPLLFRPRTAGGVHLVSPRQLPNLVGGAAVLPHTQVANVAAALDRELRPATGAAGAAPPRAARPAAPEPPAPSPPAAAPPTARAPAPGRPPVSPVSPAAGADVTVQRWRRYGKDRLYVNAADGTTLGYVDLQTDAVVPTEERHAESIRSAAARHLREG